MKIRHILISTVILMLLFCNVPNTQTESHESSGIDDMPESTGHKPSDGVTRTMIVPVLEEETVNNFNPDSNYDGNVFQGGLFVGRYPIPIWTTFRGWLKYDLSHISPEMHFVSAKIFVYLNETGTTSDNSTSVHYCDDDSWTETTITWNNQPTFSAQPEDTIDSPASPDMFIEKNWYSWDVTSAVTDTLAGDGILSLVLKQDDETETISTTKYFTEDEVDHFKASYIALQYVDPTTTGLTVDGESTAPKINYIQDSTPEYSWNFEDVGDSQIDYEFELNTTGDTQLYTENHTDHQTIYDEGDSSYAFPFWRNRSLRTQMLWYENYIPRSGVIDRLYLDVSDVGGTSITVYNFTILMLNKPTFSLSTDFSDNYEGIEPTTVFSRSEYSLTADNGKFIIDIENTFMVNNRSNLLVEFRYTNQTGDLVFCMANNTAAGIQAYNYESAYNETAKDALNRVFDLEVDYASEMIFSSGTIGNAYPFNQDEARFQWKYNQSLINKLGIIDKLYFGTASAGASVQFENFSVYLVETPVKGDLSTTFTENYGGETPTLVLERDNYTVHNIDGWLVIDIENIFTYTNQDDLLIDIRFDKKYGTGFNCWRATAMGGYRAYNVIDSNATIGLANYYTYEFAMEMVYQQTSLVPDGITLTNGTDYKFRVRTSDSAGIWSSWTEKEFRYMKLENGPSWSALSTTPEPVELGTAYTVSIDVTHPYGVFTVLIYLQDDGYTMTRSGDTFTFSGTADQLGEINFTIYMEDNLAYWSEISSSFVVEDTTAPTINSPEDIEYTEGETGNEIVWTPSDLDNGTYEILVDGVSLVVDDWYGSTVTYDVDEWSAGEYNVTIQVSDSSGNSVTDSVNVTVNEASDTTTATTTTTTTTVPEGGFDTTLILIIAGVSAVVVIVIVIVLNKRGKS